MFTAASVIPAPWLGGGADETGGSLFWKTILKQGGEIRFKTDDDELFEDSVEYFTSEGFEISYITRDLHNSDFEGNLVTEHEKMFTEEGKTIKFLIAHL